MKWPGSLVRESDAARASADHQEEQLALLEGIREGLIGVIRKTARDKRNGLIEFARQMNTYPESEILTELDRFKGYDNMNRIEALKKKLRTLLAVKSALNENTRVKEMAQIQDRIIRDDLRRIDYQIAGFVAPGGVLTIRYRDWETVYAADKGTHLSLSLAGKMGRNGRIHMIEETSRQVQNPLSYPQVQAKDAAS